MCGIIIIFSMAFFFIFQMFFGPTLYSTYLPQEYVLNKEIKLLNKVENEIQFEEALEKLQKILKRKSQRISEVYQESLICRFDITDLKNKIVSFKTELNTLDINFGKVLNELTLKKEKCNIVKNGFDCEYINSAFVNIKYDFVKLYTEYNLLENNYQSCINNIMKDSLKTTAETIIEQNSLPASADMTWLAISMLATTIIIGLTCYYYSGSLNLNIYERLQFFKLYKQENIIETVNPNFQTNLVETINRIEHTVNEIATAVT